MAIIFQMLVLAAVALFATKLTKKLDRGSKVTAILVKSFFVFIAALPFVWIYFYGGQYLGR